MLFIDHNSWRIQPDHVFLNTWCGDIGIHLKNTRAVHNFEGLKDRFLDSEEEKKPFVTMCYVEGR